MYNYYELPKEEQKKIRASICKEGYELIKENGWHVINLGYGVPLGIVNFIQPDDKVLLQGESCVIGMGDYLSENDYYDMHHVDPAGIPVMIDPDGATNKSVADAFAFINSGHLDATFLGAFQVAANGDLANWATPTMMAGAGGAMALVRGAKNVIICMIENDKHGNSKLVNRCTLPLTGHGVVKVIITDLGVYVPDGDTFKKVKSYDQSVRKYV